MYKNLPQYKEIILSFAKERGKAGFSIWDVREKAIEVMGGDFDEDSFLEAGGQLMDDHQIRASRGFMMTMDGMHASAVDVITYYYVGGFPDKDMEGMYARVRGSRR